MCSAPVGFCLFLFCLFCCGVVFLGKKCPKGSMSRLEIWCIWLGSVCMVSIIIIVMTIMYYHYMITIDIYIYIYTYIYTYI